MRHLTHVPLSRLITLYSGVSLLIETALARRLLLHLPLRQPAGFLHAVLPLMGMVLPGPDHTTLSQRPATLAVRRQVRRVSPGSMALIVDRSGLKGCGQGEWQTQKHGEKQHKRWKKLPIGVDHHGQIIASAVTDGQNQAPSHVPERNTFWGALGVAWAAQGARITGRHAGPA